MPLTGGAQGPMLRDYLSQSSFSWKRVSKKKKRGSLNIEESGSTRVVVPGLEGTSATCLRPAREKYSQPLNTNGRKREATLT